MALSAWGVIPDDMEIDFPTMWAPDAKEIAEIAERKTNAILAVYQNDLIDSATAQQELQAIADERECGVKYQMKHSGREREDLYQQPYDGGSDGRGGAPSESG